VTSTITLSPRHTWRMSKCLQSGEGKQLQDKRLRFDTRQSHEFFTVRRNFGAHSAPCK
jgi:hypothetical protein